MEQKVICISQTDHNNIFVPIIAINEIVTVIDDIKHNGFEYYQFAEYPESERGAKAWYLKSNFAPIQTQYSDITASIASEMKETREVPDKIVIKESINN